MRLPARNHFSIKQPESKTNELTIQTKTGINVHRARPTSIFFKPSLAFFSLSTTFFALAAACTCKAILPQTCIHILWTQKRTRVIHSKMNICGSHKLVHDQSASPTNLKCCGSCFTTAPLYLAGCLHGRESGSGLHQTC